MPTLGVAAVWLTIKRTLIIIYNDVYDEHLFVFAAGLSYYFVLSLFPLLVSMASLLGYVPIPHLFDGLLSLMARLVPGDGMSLVRNIVSGRCEPQTSPLFYTWVNLHHLDSVQRICCHHRRP